MSALSSPTSSGLDLREWFGEIDIYLFDQLLKGNLAPPMRVLDAGCGWGRNLPYLLRAGFDVCAVDTSAEAMEGVRALAARWAPHLSAANFRLEPLESLSFDDESFDAVVSSAVLHFARDEAHFRAMMREAWRVLKPGGVFFARLASSIGIEDLVHPIEGRRYWLPDGTERFLVDEDLIVRVTRELHGELVEPLKTVNVQHQRCMTTWVMTKRESGRT
jgi:SAM-dependent methyltransferase